MARKPHQQAPSRQATQANSKGHTPQTDIAPATPVPALARQAGLLHRNTGHRAFPLGANTVIQLQRQLGNRQVQRLIHQSSQAAPQSIHIQRHFPEPQFHNIKQSFKANVAKSKNANVPTTKQGWSIDKERTGVQELTSAAPLNGEKTTRFTAFLTPGHAKIGGGKATVANVRPIGWSWIEANEARSAKRKAIAYWVKFHLLNAKLGGKGGHELHLIPADKSANSQWESGIENPMKTAITSHALYYDVQIDYYSQGEAPASYNTGGQDYSANITLFPKTIKGKWSIYDPKTNGWKPQAPCNVTSSKPSGPGGAAQELVGAANLGMLSGMYKIDSDVLKIVQKAAAKTAFTTYGQVRARLENWVAAVSNDTNQYNSRMKKLAVSDGYLRSALDGSKPSKLTINGKAVPDDDTPQAKFFDSPAKIKNAADVRGVPNMRPQLIGAYQDASGIQGQGQRNQIPTMKEFFERVFKNYLWGDTYASIQSDWDSFVSSTTNLPPMIHTDFAPDGEEVQTTVAAKRSEVEAAVLQICQGKLPQHMGQAALKELVVLAMQAFIPFINTFMHVLTVKDYEYPEQTAAKLLTSPAVQPLYNEFIRRCDLTKKIIQLGAQNQFPNPLQVSLQTPLDPTIEASLQQIETQQQQQQLLAQQQAQQQLLAQQQAQQLQQQLQALQQLLSARQQQPQAYQGGFLSPYAFPPGSYTQPQAPFPTPSSTNQGLFALQQQYPQQHGGNQYPPATTVTNQQGLPPTHQPTGKHSGGPVRSSYSERQKEKDSKYYPESKQHTPYPKSGNIHPYNQQVIDAITNACDEYERTHMSQWVAEEMEDKKRAVLSSFRTSIKKGYGDFKRDFKKAMLHITGDQQFMY